jgi:multidrug efflux pump subunit AcrB
VFFALSILGAMFTPNGVRARIGLEQLVLHLELPPGVRLEDTAAASAAAYRIVSQYPEVTDVVESIGADEFGEVRTASLYISLVPPNKRRDTQQEWEKRVH